MAHFEKRLSSETKFEGRVITVTLDRVELENGGTSTREVVRHHGGAGVAALNDEGEIYLVRQYRYALDRELIEIPAGKLEKGEDPLEAAKRELGEEAGLAAAEYRDLGYIIPTCGYCSEIIYLYAAKGLSPVGQHLDADEFLSVFTLRRHLPFLKGAFRNERCFLHLPGHKMSAEPREPRQGLYALHWEMPAGR